MFPRVEARCDACYFILRLQLLELADLFTPEVTLYLIEFMASQTRSDPWNDDGSDADLSLSGIRKDEEGPIFGDPSLMVIRARTTRCNSE